MCGQFGRYKPTAISASGIDLNEERSHLFVFFPFQLMSFYCSVIGFVAVFESFEGLWIWVQIFKVFEMSLNFVGKGEQSLYLTLCLQAFKTGSPVSVFEITHNAAEFPMKKCKHRSFWS